jgi:hypothetical protein
MAKFSVPDILEMPATNLRSCEMASAMALMKKMDLSTGTGLGYVALDGAVGFGTSYGLGRLYSQHNDKWWGKQAPRIAAGVGKLGAMALFAFGAPALVVGGVNAMGQAGVDAIGLEMGLRHGRAKTGKKAVLVPADADIKKIPGASDMASIGALGRAPAGKGLSWDAIEELAAGH